MAKRKWKEESPVVEEPHVEESDWTKNPVIATVIDCEKLNIRMEPKPNAKIVCQVDKGTEMEIDLEESTPDWAKVILASGIEGYCMRSFIELSM